MAGPRLGTIRIRRCLVVIVPCLLVVGAIVVGIGAGAVSVTIITDKPLVVGTSGGTGRDLRAAVGSQRAASAGEADRGALRVELSSGSLDDICLSPTVDLPVLGSTTVGLRIDGTVDIRDVTLALSGADLGATAKDLDLGVTDRNTEYGTFATSGDADGDVVLKDADLKVIGLTLHDGILPKSVKISVADHDFC
ncbi:MAG: hypothetical protein QM572_13010 [Nocardioides sp.]|uniref:hypothetical protein n=1 Tax=Nocardioides sp. TaxID=35761 RepID=UPI0039E26BE5